MSGLTYASLRQRIRDAPVIDPGDQSSDALPIDNSTGDFETLFQGSGGNREDEPPLEPAGTILDLRLTRIASGWGGIVGLAGGALIGASGGFPGMIAGAILGMLIVSIAAIGGLVLLGASTARIGAAWTVSIAAMVVVMITWLLAL